MTIMTMAYVRVISNSLSNIKPVPFAAVLFAAMPFEAAREACPDILSVSLIHIPCRSKIQSRRAKTRPPAL